MLAPSTSENLIIKLSIIFLKKAKANETMSLKTTSVTPVNFSQTVHNWCSY